MNHTENIPDGEDWEDVDDTTDPDPDAPVEEPVDEEPVAEEPVTNGQTDG